MNDQVNSSLKPLNRRELGKMAFAGALGATQLVWAQSSVAQERASSTSDNPQTPVKPALKLMCLSPSSATEEDLLFYKQVGVEGLFVTGKMPDDYTVDGLQKVRKRFADAGFMIEMLPAPVNTLMRDIVLNGPGRDKAIEDYKVWIRTLASAGLYYIPQTFNLSRAVISGLADVRGSHARDFDINGSALWEQEQQLIVGNPIVGNKDQPQQTESALRTPGGAKGPANALLFGREYSKDEIWANYTHFIRQVAPVLEETGVKIGFHPDDPPTPSLFGIAHIFANFEDYKKALEIANSPNVGVLLCCGTWAEGTTMGIDIPGAIHYFASQKKLFEIHFRNVSSTLPHFNETYPDAGYYDQYKVMKALMDVKYSGFVQLDHMVPMVGGLHTYEAFAIGYMRALAQRAQIEDGA